MGELIIRDLDDKLLVQLKQKAWEQGLPLHESLRRAIIASVEREPMRNAGIIMMAPLPHLHDTVRAERLDRVEKLASLNS
jgi:hypothetical protein